MTEASADVLHEKRDQAFWITINRPDKRNAINADVIAGIRAGYREAHADPQMRAIVLTAAGEKAFCAGGDLQPGKGFAFDLSRPNIDYADLMREAQNATLPTVARINGVCMAGGMGLLCMTDFAVAADHVLFGLPEVKVGLFPMQVMSLLQDLAPRRKLREWALSGEPFSASDAFDAGLLNYVVPSGELDMSNADEVAAQIADIQEPLGQDGRCPAFPAQDLHAGLWLKGIGPDRGQDGPAHSGQVAELLAGQVAGRDDQVVTVQNAADVPGQRQLVPLRGGDRAGSIAAAGWVPADASGTWPGR